MTLKLEYGVLSATRVMGPIFFSDTISSERYVEQILAQFFEIYV
jgi:hypothetical protein